MQIKVLDKKIKAADLRDFAKFWYQDFLKGVVDVQNKRVAVGGEWHIEGLEVLVQAGGTKDEIWGFNIVFGENGSFFEYHSLVNLKPTKKHTQMEIIDKNILHQINAVLDEFIEL